MRTQHQDEKILVIPSVCFSQSTLPPEIVPYLARQRSAALRVASIIATASPASEVPQAALYSLAFNNEVPRVGGKRTSRKER